MGKILNNTTIQSLWTIVTIQLERITSLHVVPLWPGCLKKHWAELEPSGGIHDCCWHFWTWQKSCHQCVQQFPSILLWIGGFSWRELRLSHFWFRVIWTLAFTLTDKKVYYLWVKWRSCSRVKVWQSFIFIAKYVGDFTGNSMPRI